MSDTAGLIAQVASAAVALAALLVSANALKHARHVAADTTGGTFAIAYRDHVWNLWRAGLDVDEIEALLRKESIEPSVNRTKGNSYDGFLDAHGRHIERGLAPEIASVADILDPLERYRSSSGSVVRPRGKEMSTTPAADDDPPDHSG